MGDSVQGMNVASLQGKHEEDDSQAPLLIIFQLPKQVTGGNSGLLKSAVTTEEVHRGVGELFASLLSLTGENGRANNRKCRSSNAP